MSGKAWVVGWLPTSISRKFALFFAVLLAIVIASGMIVARSLERLHGTGTQIDLSGSLRYLTRNIQVNTQHYAALGMRADLAELEDNLAKFHHHFDLLRSGGTHLGREMPPLPHESQSVLSAIENAFGAYEKEIRAVLTVSDRRQFYEQQSGVLHQRASEILQAADALTNALSKRLDAAQAEIRNTLLVLVLIDGAILLVGLLAIRVRIVHPLRNLAMISRRIAEGQYGERIDYSSRDEIGLLSSNIDDMAASIQLRELDLVQSKESLLRANRALRLLSSVNQATISATEEQGLLDEMCQLAVNVGGYHSAFVGRAENNSEQSITVVASEGVPDEYLACLNISWADNARGQGVAGTAVRENRTSVVHQLRSNPRFSPWRELAIRLGIEDAIGLPVKVGGRIWGVICLYSTSSIAFDDNETLLLQEMADDLGFGIETLHARRKQQAMERALREANEQLERRVLERTKELEDANRELETFSYSVSHDLRSPLRAMDGFASLLTQEYGPVLDDKGLDYLARIRKATRRMAALIDDLLELARISKAEIIVRDVDLSSLASELLAEFSAADPRKGAKIDIESNLWVKGDPNLLRILLQNLLENAWKYTGKRSAPEISFGLTKGPLGEPAYYVQDNGVGFEMEHAHRLFQPFIRLHSTEDFPGTGIGLATVSRIVSRHGGRIWVQSEVGKGSTFYFTLT